ncbi:MAG TPA: nuclear transport factor 2 family protein [Acidimicrobiia bacterium]|nr:nuclear transport factor 2 family protein [Acidimicrobiia bacterium]
MTQREDARAVVERVVQFYNAKDLDGLAALYADDITLWSSLGAEASGKQAFLDHIRHLFDRLPDERMTADVVVTDGATAVLELTSRGTDDGLPYEISFTEVFEIANGLLTSVKTYIDPDTVP